MFINLHISLLKWEPKKGQKGTKGFFGEGWSVGTRTLTRVELGTGVWKLLDSGITKLKASDNGKLKPIPVFGLA